MLDQNQTAVLFARKLKRLNQHSTGQGYANLFRLALGHYAKSPEVKKPAHLPGYGALRDRKALCDIAIDRILTLPIIPTSAKNAALSSTECPRRREC